MSETIRPQTELERGLVRIWEQVLQRGPIGIQQDFFDLGGTSVQAASIFAGIEEAFHKRLPLSVILGAPTIELLAASLLPGKSGDRKACVVPIQRNGEKPVLFCIGGGAHWRCVSEHLGPDRPVFSVELEPGAMERIKGPNLMEKLARQMVSAICEKQPQGPYVLGGFCRDGVFAYEVARQLTMYGQEVGLLILFEPFNPCGSVAARVATALKRMIFRVGYRFCELRRLGTGEFPLYARNRWKGFKGSLKVMAWRGSARFQFLPRQSRSQDSEQLLFSVASSYKPKPLDCSTAIFRCKDWPMLSAGDPYFGWGDLLTGRTEIHEVPGDHQGMFREPNVEILGEKLRNCLQNAGELHALCIESTKS